MKYLIFLLVSFSLPTGADTPRREVANHIFEFLRLHAVRDENNPLDYACNLDPYEMHWAAKKLYSATPLKQIKLPDSQFDRGCYEPYNVFTWMEHDGILVDIYSLISGK
jgi:hypothetical protein